MDITRTNLLALIQNGLQQHGLSISALEKQAGVPKDTVRDFLRAKTQILRADKLQKILRILQPEERLALTGELNALGEVVPWPEDKQKEMVDFPPSVDTNGVAALRVRGSAMAPVFHEGWILYYATSHAPMVNKPSGWQVPYGGGAAASQDPYAAFLDKPCVIKLADGRLVVRTLKPGGEGKYVLAAYGAPDMQNVTVKDVYKIIFIKTE